MTYGKDLPHTVEAFEGAEHSYPAQNSRASCGLPVVAVGQRDN